VSAERGDLMRTGLHHAVARRRICNAAPKKMKQKQQELTGYQRSASPNFQLPIEKYIRPFVCSEP